MPRLICLTGNEGNWQPDCGGGTLEQCFATCNAVSSLLCPALAIEFDCHIPDSGIKFMLPEPQHEIKQCSLPPSVSTHK